MSDAAHTLILVAEDEALVRMHASDLLERAGFEVLEAKNADEAVAHLQNHPTVQLLFSDIDMPGSMDGLELAALVHRRWPRIGLLLTSGHHQPKESALPDNGKFIAKPWAEGCVLEQISTILTARVGAT